MKEIRFVRWSLVLWYHTCCAKKKKKKKSDVYHILGKKKKKHIYIHRLPTTDLNIFKPQTSPT